MVGSADRATTTFFADRYPVNPFVPAVSFARCGRPDSNGTKSNERPPSSTRASPGAPRASHFCICTISFRSERVREISRERSRGQPGTIEIGPVEPREWNAPGSHHGFACEHPGGIREGSQPGTEIRIELARNSVQRQKGFAQEEKVERHWMALQSQLPHDLERGVQWIAPVP
jgi:hypothetical protein